MRVLLGNIGNIREIDFWLCFNLFRKVKDEKLKDKICDSYVNILEDFGEKFSKEIKSNIDLTEFKKNHIEDFNFYPPYEDTNYNSLEYEAKVKYLNNLPIIETHKQQSLKKEYILDKIDLYKDKSKKIRYHLISFKS